MGTSSSYLGPTGTNPLLPPWAEPIVSDEAASDEAESADGADGDSAEAGDRDGASEPEPVRTHLTAPTAPVSWSSPKRHVGRAADGRASASYKATGRAYVRASGGARTAASAAVSGRSTTTRLGGFLADAARNGFAEAARHLGLRDLVGRGAQYVMASLIDLLAPDGAMREEAAARKALIETMSDLFEQCDVEGEGMDALNSIGADGMKEILSLSVTNYINERMQQELVFRIEQGTLPEAEANRVCEELRDFISGVVHLDFKGVDLLALDWAREGKALVDNIYLTAYSLLEEGS